MKLRILIVHNTYQQKGGEDVVVKNEAELLRSRNHGIKVVLLNNAEIFGLIGKIFTFFSASYSFSSKRQIQNALKSFKPDVIHVHNFFPLVSPSVYDVAKDFNIPVVQTLHNYRIACPGAFFLRKGVVCEKCITGNFMHSIIYKCYKGSYLGSASLASMDFIHKCRRTWNERISKIICLTDFAKNKFVQFGIHADNITVKPNFVNSDVCAFNKDSRENVGLFVGRISHEKGIKNLIQIHDTIKGKVLIAGDGPLLEELKGLKNFILLGHKTSDEIKGLMSQASFLIFPSIWYEGFPMTIVEAFSNGLPVVASKIGAMEEIIDNGKTGIHFQLNNLDEMAEKINWAFDNFDIMREYGENAFNVYNDLYTSEINYKILMSVYKEVIINNEQRR